MTQEHERNGCEHTRCVDRLPGNNVAIGNRNRRPQTNTSIRRPSATVCGAVAVPADDGIEPLGRRRKGSGSSNEQKEMEKAMEEVSVKQCQLLDLISSDWFG